MTDDNFFWYLAGPMSGLPEQNYPAFEAACVKLREMGFKIMSPHETIHHPTQPGEEMWQRLLREDLSHMIIHCKGIILLPGWSRSKGARLELSTATTLGMPVRFYKNGFLFDFS